MNRIGKRCNVLFYISLAIFAEVLGVLVAVGLELLAD
jgi:hypothetical protein